MVIAGKVPAFVVPFFFGAALTAFQKKTGGIRPIACGLTLRRLATKILMRQEVDTFREVLLPTQVGCGVKGGCEAAVHASRVFLDANKETGKVLVKLDFKNAFNSVRRDYMLQSVAKHFPRLQPLAQQAYGRHTMLLAGSTTLTSASGIQQGDPAGPAIFCAAVKDLADSLESELRVCYLDDFTIGGDVESVLSDINRVIEFAPKSGLQLQLSKREYYPWLKASMD